MEEEKIMMILINIVTFMGGIFTGFGICIRYNKNLPRLNDVENVITTHYPINTFNSPQINATAPPPSPVPLSLDSSAIVAEETNQREIIIKN
tara:strand:- start:805 stop:1080 length:276 start_codon:yes stop_codon:yes gene_type:complete